MTSGTTKYWWRIVASSAVYAAASWAAVEALTTVIDRLGLPAWLGTLATALFVAGLPVTVFLVWRTVGEERRLNTTSFIGAMTFLILGTAAIFWFTRPPPVVPVSLVAIVPCEFSGKADHAYRAEGLAEDLHARLSRVDDVKISSWNSSLYVRDKGYGPAQIAEVLNINRLVQCRMKSSSERIELTAELIDPMAGQILWHRDYDFVAGDLGTVITELAGTLLDVLGTRVEAAEMDRVNDLGTFSPEAYDLYLQASVAGNRDIADSSIVQALQIDPNFPNALVLRAGIYMDRAMSQDFETMEEPRAWLYETRSLSLRALEIDPGAINSRRFLAAVCLLLGEYYDEHCPAGEAEKLIRSECEVRGDTAEGWACWTEVLPAPEDLAALERWLELEPTSSEGNMQYMIMLSERDADFAELLAVFDTLRALDPDDRRPLGMVSNLLREEGRLDEVLAWRYGAFGDRIPEGMPWHLARLSTDYMSLGLYEQAMEPGLLTWETRPSSATHFMHILWTRLGETEKAEAMLEQDVKTVGVASPRGLIHYADSYASVLGSYDRAKDLYEQALASQDLPMLCEEEEDCVAWHTLTLVRTERALGNDRAADEWLAMAEAAIDSEEENTPEDAVDNRLSLLDAMLLIAHRRYPEAVAMLRQIAFNWDSQGGQDLELPIYLLENAALFDPLRDMPEFQQLLDDYNAWLEPMRQRVLAARHSGDWEALRQRTYQWAHQSASQSTSGD